MHSTESGDRDDATVPVSDEVLDKTLSEAGAELLRYVGQNTDRNALLLRLMQEMDPPQVGEEAGDE